MLSLSRVTRKQGAVTGGVGVRKAVRRPPAEKIPRKKLLKIGKFSTLNMRRRAISRFHPLKKQGCLEAWKVREENIGPGEPESRFFFFFSRILSALSAKISLYVCIFGALNQYMEQPATLLLFFSILL